MPEISVHFNLRIRNLTPEAADRLQPMLERIARGLPGAILNRVEHEEHGDYATLLARKKIV